MNRFSIKLKQEGPVSLIRMTSRFMGLPLFRVYAFFVNGLLIDTGFTNCRFGFLKLCERLPSLHTIVNTHHHEDHTGNNFWLRRRYGLLPLAHPKTSSYLRVPDQWVKIYRRFIWGTPPPSETGEVDSEIRTSRFRFLVIPTPGHSDDHICLYEPNEGWLFSGDLFIKERLKYLREDEDIHSVIDSLKKVAGLRPKKMFCSFSGLIDHPEESLQRKISNLEALQHRIEEGLKQGLSPQEVRRRILGRGDQFKWITQGQISKQNLINAFIRQKERKDEEN